MTARQTIARGQSWSHKLHSATPRDEAADSECEGENLIPQIPPLSAYRMFGFAISCWVNLTCASYRGKKIKHSIDWTSNEMTENYESYACMLYTPWFWRFCQWCARKMYLVCSQTHYYYVKRFTSFISVGIMVSNDTSVSDHRPAKAAKKLSGWTHTVWRPTVQNSKILEEEKKKKHMSSSALRNSFFEMSEMRDSRAAAGRRATFRGCMYRGCKTYFGLVHECLGWSLGLE